MSSLFYFFREGLVGFKRNLSTTMGSIITIFLSLLIVGLFCIGGMILTNIVQSVESEVSIQAFLSDDADDSLVKELMNTWKSDPLVKSVGYTSKDEALEKFRGVMSGNAEIADQLDGNPLPASIDLELNDPHDVEILAKKIAADSKFAQVCEEKSNPQASLLYGQSTVEMLFAVTDSIRIIGIILISLLIFIAMIFINNTIRLAILARRKEIAIMRLVGASNSFIRGPFFMESCIHSTIGALFAIFVLECIKSFGIPQLSNTLKWMPINLNIESYVFIYIILLIAGLIIGLIGSAFSMRRYLNV